MKTVMCALLMAGMMTIGAAFAAEVSPGLDDEMKASGAAEWISAIVILESPIDIRVLDEQLHAESAPLARRHQEVIQALKSNAAATQPAFLQELEQAKASGDVRGYTAYWIENLIVLQASSSFLESLRARGDVKYLCEDFRPELIEPVPEGHNHQALDAESTTPGQDATGATQINRELGLNGQGVLVAHCDTGADGAHPALAARWRGNFAPVDQCWRDEIGANPNFPVDLNGHGTHVMGTMTGRAISGADTITVGAAPKALWVATNAVDQGGSPGGAFDNDIVDVYQWYADPDGNPNTMDDVPDVIQNSWGVYAAIDPGYTCYTFWNTVVQNCEAAGPVITWSAGNEAAAGLRSPATLELNSYQNFAVGAVDATNNGAPYPLAYDYSSQGPSRCPPNPLATKPEIAAPGTDIYSSLPGGGYGLLSGTSMAGPHVAGIVALMREACPDCDYIDIKSAMMNTADDYGVPGEDNLYGHGFINGYAAVQAVSVLGRISGVVRNTANEVLAGARVAAGGKEAFTDANGVYYLPLVAGTYALEFSKFGYQNSSASGVVLAQNDTTYQDGVLTAAAEAHLSGTVTDCIGGPAVGAQVEVLGAPLPPAITDADGFYSFALPQATYDVRASQHGCGTQTVTGILVSGNTTQNFALAPDIRFQCSAADGGGYTACEDEDYDGPAYNWLEISPLAGGPGLPSGVVGDDQAIGYALPFNFRLYGVDFDSVWISSNGILTFDYSDSAFANEALPVASLGHAVVVYWDDYLPADGDISYYHDTAQDAFVVEWHNIRPSGIDLTPIQTFEVMLFNPATHPTPNGDGRILMQYLNVSSSTSATIGIQDSAVANLYLHNGALDPNAMGIASGRAIEFGRPPSEFLLAQPAVSPDHGTPDDVFTYSILYTSPANQPPVSATVVIDGSPFAMTTTDNDYSNGSVYTFQALLGYGVHNYSFMFQGATTSQTRPESGTYPGPTVGQQTVCYDFESGDAGWTVGALGDLATTGIWSRGDPEPTFSVGMVQPGDDHTPDPGVNCFATDPDAGSAAGDFDVDGGTTTLFSPVIDLSPFNHAALETWTWYSNDQGTNPLGLDSFRLAVSSDGGTSWVNLFNRIDDWEYWRNDQFPLENYVTLTNQVKLRFVVGETDQALVEAAVDDICITAYSNILPTPDSLTIHYSVPANELEFHWKAAPGATQYTLYSSATSDGPFSTSEGTTTETQLTLPMGTDGLRFYVVVASTTAGVSARPADPDGRAAAIR